MKNVDTRFVQIAIGSDPSAFANFDLQLSVLGTKANVELSIIPAGDGWYRCTMTTTTATGIAFVVYLTTAASAIRAQGKTTPGAIFIYFPQMELGPIATSYILTNGSRVTRAADIILKNVSKSMFRLYGSRDFTGNRGERGERRSQGESIVGPPGSNVNLPPWVSFQQYDVGLSNFGGTLAASRITDLPTQVTLPTWVLPSQSSISLSNFGGNIPSSRVADLPVQVRLPEWLNVLQEDISISSFGGSLDHTKVVNVPLLASLPTYVVLVTTAVDRIIKRFRRHG
jgi:hypothetical protein